MVREQSLHLVLKPIRFASDPYVIEESDCPRSGQQPRPHLQRDIQQSDPEGHRCEIADAGDQQNRKPVAISNTETHHGQVYVWSNRSCSHLQLPKFLMSELIVDWHRFALAEGVDCSADPTEGEARRASNEFPRRQ